MSCLMVALALVASSPAPAAEHELDLFAGIAPVVRTDLLLSPLRYTGAMPTGGLGWTATGPRASTRAGFDLAIGGLRSGPDWTWFDEGESHETSGSASTLVDLRVAHGRRLGEGRWRVELGGSFDARLEQHTYAFAFTGLSTYLGLFTLGPWMGASRDLGNHHHLAFEAGLPLLPWVARQGYSVQDDAYIWHNRDTNALFIIGRYIGAGHLASPLEHQSGHLQARWGVDLSSHLGLEATARFDLLHLTEPEPILEWQLGVHTGLRGSF